MTTATTLPLDFQEKIENLSKLYKTYFPSDDKDFPIFETFIEKNYKLAYNNNNTIASINRVENIYSDLKDFIRVNEHQIPENILPKNKTGYLKDINVQVSNEYKRKQKKLGVNTYQFLTDDYVYKNHQHVQKYIPRGLTICRIYDDVAKEEFHDFCIYVNKKFTGLTDQDDDDSKNNSITDDDNYISKYFTQEPSTQNIIFMEKINGEAFHISGRYLKTENEGNKFYFFVGSKNNHIMISENSDIDLYTDPRYTQAKKFAKSFMKLLKTISKEKLDILYSILHYTKVTIICEILQPSYQHIVYIPGKDDKIVFLAFCPTFNDDINLIAFPPHIACKVLQVLGITTTNYRIFTGTDEEKRKEFEKVRLTKNSEGYVLYFLNSNLETIGLVKLKTNWYIFLRALREKLSKYIHKEKNDKIKERVNERYDEIQKWLKLTNSQVNEWKENAGRFIDWLETEEKLTYRKEAAEIKSDFPKLWEKFLDSPLLETGKFLH